MNERIPPDLRLDSIRADPRFKNLMLRWAAALGRRQGMNARRTVFPKPYWPECPQAGQRINPEKRLSRKFPDAHLWPSDETANLDLEGSILLDVSASQR
jgi:hypothetical protein